MISRPYGIQNSIKSRWNTLFPRAVRMILNNILWEPRTWSSAALAKFSERKYILPAQLRLLLLAFPHFAASEAHNQTDATRRTTRKKNCSSSANAPETHSFFVVGANTKLLGANA